MAQLGYMYHQAVFATPCPALLAFFNPITSKTRVVTPHCGMPQLQPQCTPASQAPPVASPVAEGTPARVTARDPAQAGALCFVCCECIPHHCDCNHIGLSCLLRPMPPLPRCRLADRDVVWDLKRAVATAWPRDKDDKCQSPCQKDVAHPSGELLNLGLCQMEQSIDMSNSRRSG
jgi:hypothetical protein